MKVINALVAVLWQWINSSRPQQPVHLTDMSFQAASTHSEKSPRSWCFWGETSSTRGIWLYSVCRSFKSNLPSFGGRISHLTYSALNRHVWKKRKFGGNVLCCYLCLYSNLVFLVRNVMWKLHYRKCAVHFLRVYTRLRD